MELQFQSYKIINLLVVYIYGMVSWLGFRLSFKS